MDEWTCPFLVEDYKEEQKIEMNRFFCGLSTLTSTNLNSIIVLLFKIIKRGLFLEFMINSPFYIDSKCLDSEKRETNKSLHIFIDMRQKCGSILLNIVYMRNDNTSR